MAGIGDVFDKNKVAIFVNRKKDEVRRMRKMLKDEDIKVDPYSPDAMVNAVLQRELLIEFLEAMLEEQ